MSHHTVEVRLGPKSQVEAMFSYHPDPNVSAYEWLAQGFCQTLLRDLKYGSWAVVSLKDGEPGQEQDYWVKITSPDQEVAGYERIIRSFMEAGRIGYGIYQQNQASIDQHHLFFILPQGMAMAEIRGIQLLHYPPYEARAFADYLYSPTNRRWESLLGYNGFDGARNTLLERITDMVPLAGPGSDASGIDLFNETFLPYAKAMLTGFLDPVGFRTQPVVAYGTPVHEWLPKAFPNQISKPLEVLEVVEVEIAREGSRTPILGANHPSMFLFFHEHDWDWAVNITREDLIAARWQVRMSQDWGADPKAVLDEAREYWNSRPDEVAVICGAQEEEFGFAL